MAIEFECPHCRSRIRTPDEAAGKKARCPHCQQISPVPPSSSPEPLGNLGSSTAPLPSSQPAWPPSSTPTATNPPLNTPASKLTPPVNPFLNPTPLNPNSASPQPAAWLPPADAFAPIGSPPSSSGYQHPYPQPQPQPASTNPFGDQPSNYSGATSNPYQSPASAANYANRPLTPDEIRQMLLGPAIGMAVGAVICIGIVTLFTVLLLMDADFHKEIQGPNQADTIGVYAVFAFFVFLGIGPPLVVLFGSWSMLVGRGLVSAWIGAIAGLLNPCCLISGGFAIWGMVILSDPRVSAGMK